MKSILKSKRGQSDLLVAIGVILGLLILAPFLVMIVNVPLEKFKDTINSTDVGNAQASANVDSVRGKFLSMIDFVFICAILVNVILLLITAFMVDVHPAFMLIFIMLCFFTMVFVPEILTSVLTVWDKVQGQSEVIGHLPVTYFILNNFRMFMLAVMFISGVVMYAKIRRTG